MRMSGEILVSMLLSGAPLGFCAEGRGAADGAAENHESARLRLFAPAWRDIGERGPQEVARQFTVIFGHLAPGPFHEGNPEAKCVKYILGPYVAKRLLEVLPAEALAHDRDGQFVKARSWPNWLVVPDNAKWLEHVTDVVRKLMDSDFDGLFVDSMGTAPVDSNYLLAQPINPNTGKPYTRREWLAAECAMLDAIQKAMPPGKIVTLNGLGPGQRYWTEPESASPRVLLSYVDGAMSELIWRVPHSPLTAWPTPDQWMGEVRMIQDVERRGLMGFWWTKCWSDGNTSWNEPNAETLVPQWRRFALASYLLAAGPRSYFNFDTCKNDKPKSNAAERFPEYDAPLGTAIGPMRELKDGVYGRTFSNGLVVANPTARHVEQVSVPGAGTDADHAYHSWGENRALGQTFDVNPHTGLILTRGGTPTSDGAPDSRPSR